MDTSRPLATPTTSRLARTFTKILHIQPLTGISPNGRALEKPKYREKTKKDPQTNHRAESPSIDAENETLKSCLVYEAFIAKIFAALSCIKAAYAQMQYAQSPYDSEKIQFYDQTIVSELKNLSGLKQLYLNKEIDEGSPETAIALSEIREQSSLVKMFELTSKKLDFQLKLKESELTFLLEKLAESSGENRLLERKLSSSDVSGGILQSSDVKTSHFAAYHRQVVKSVRSFVRVLVQEMASAGWDLDAAAGSAEPGVSFQRRDHRGFAFESYVCRQMLDGLFGPVCTRPDPGSDSFDTFREIRSTGAAEHLSWRPESSFASFCREMYLRLVHPKMEASLFGNSEQRDLLLGISGSRRFPETRFFSAFCQVAKDVWLLRCLASCLEEEVAVFEVAKGSRFSEVYMESVSDEAASSSDPGGLGDELRVAFTVVPGLRVGRTVVQCQVYLC